MLTLSILNDFVSWVLINKVTIGIVLFILWKRNPIWKHLIFEPLTDGNGVVKTYEWTRYMFVIVWMYAVGLDHREVSWDIALILTIGVLTIAKLDKALDVIKEIRIHRDKPKSE